jgi:DNA-binding SARP family transcriptional activator
MSDGSTRRKLRRVLAKYDLEHLEDELAAMWTRETDRYTLRELESWVNARVVEAAMRDAGMDPLGDEPETVRRLLADDDAPAGERAACRQRLAEAGVDVDALVADLVTYNAVYAVLSEDRGAEPPGEDVPRPERVKRRLRRLRERAERVTADGLASLSADDAVAGEAEPRVTFAVRCRDCGHRMPAVAFVDNGGCESCLGD